jgi:hypothetical protein
MLKETDAVNSDNFFIPLLSLERTWSMVKKERNSAWNAIYSFATGSYMGKRKKLIMQLSKLLFSKMICTVVCFW